MGLDITGRYRYPPPQPGWLALQAEEAIDPELPIVDAHHHLWEERGSPYLVEDFADDLASGHNVVATVAVEARHGYRADGPEELRPVGETERLAALPSPCIAAGIVGFADLTLGSEVAGVIEAHLEAAPRWFRGVRHSVSHDPHFPNGIVLRPARPGLLADPQYRAGMAVLTEYGLSYDAMLYHCQMPELTAAARALPQLPIVLDHLGCVIGVGPYEGQARENFLQWRNDMTALARCENVSVKLGGMGMIICGAEWHARAHPPSSRELAAAWRPYFETAIELFGAGRCMFESNFPVDKAMFSYPVLWNAFKRITAGCSDGEKAALFHGTAARFYRIDLPAKASAESPHRAHEVVGA
jgi:predicted TIM-barrel fold metal-dependent hydrolase